MFPYTLKKKVVFFWFYIFFLHAVFRINQDYQREPGNLVLRHFTSHFPKICHKKYSFQAISILITNQLPILSHITYYLNIIYYLISRNPLSPISQKLLNRTWWNLLICFLSWNIFKKRPTISHNMYIYDITGVIHYMRHMSNLQPPLYRSIKISFILYQFYHII